MFESNGSITQQGTFVDDVVLQKSTTTTQPNLIANYTPSGWDFPIVASSVSGTNTVGPDLQAGADTYIDFAFLNTDATIPTSTEFYVYLYGAK